MIKPVYEEMATKYTDVAFGKVDVDDNSDATSSQFLVRRSRLKFDGFAFTPKLKYKAELGLTNRDIAINSEDGNTRDAARIILDAVLKYEFYGEQRAGHNFSVSLEREERTFQSQGEKGSIQGPAQCL